MKLESQMKEGMYNGHTLYMFFTSYQDMIGSINLSHYLRSVREVYLFSDKKYIYVATNKLFLDQNWKNVGTFRVDGGVSQKDITKLVFGLGYEGITSSYPNVSMQSFDPNILYSFDCNTVNALLFINEEKTCFKFLVMTE